jgi:hypothetical protein
MAYGTASTVQAHYEGIMHTCNRHAGLANPVKELQGSKPFHMLGSRVPCGAKIDADVVRT